MLEALEPRSLSNIWSEIHQPYFRVRDVETLEDYLIVGIKHYMQGLPHFLSAIKCDEVSFGQFLLQSWEKKYALLSTREELEFLPKFGAERQIAFKVKYFYRAAANRFNQ